MSYIFMDESGDLGFNFSKTNTSRYFVMSFLISDSDDICRKIVAKTVKKMTLRNRANFSGVFHCNKENEDVRSNLLNTLGNNESLKVISVTLDKIKFMNICGNELPSSGELYNHICLSLFKRLYEHSLFNQKERKLFIASQRETNKYLNEKFKDSLANIYDLEVIISHPNTYKGLQVVDFVSWSFFRQYEFESSKYTNLFKILILDDFVIKRI